MAQFAAHQVPPFDSGPTVSPQLVTGNGDYSDPYTSSASEDPTVCYAHLEFPDCDIPIREAAVVLGRDNSIYEFERENTELRIDGKPTSETPTLQSKALVDGTNDGGVDQILADGEDSQDGVEAVRQKHTVEGGAVRSHHFGSAGQDNGEYRIDLHPPADEDTGRSNIRSISKRHLRLYFRASVGWIMQVLGRNGAWINDEYYSHNAEAKIHDRDRLQIAGLEFVFHNPDDGYGDSGEEDAWEDTGPIQNVRSRESSEDAITTRDQESDESDSASNTPSSFTSGKKGPPVIRLTHNKSKVKAKVSPVIDSRHVENSTSTMSENKFADDEAQVDKPKAPANKKKIDFNVDDYLKPGEVFERKKGPGRPPANGFMSQREIRERKKELNDRKGDGHSFKSKNKSASKDPETSEQLGIAKRGKKRRRSGSLIDETVETLEEDEKEENASSKAAPAPAKKRTDYTEEQLKKPEGTTHERLYAIFDDAEGPLALPQIYAAIRDRWPYFLFTQTVGWESSVRHTLSQHPCFVSAGKEGKGQLWTLDRSVPFERKQRVTQTPQQPSIPAPGRTPMPSTAQSPLPPRPNPYAATPGSYSTAPGNLPQQRAYPPPSSFPTNNTPQPPLASQRAGPYTTPYAPSPFAPPIPNTHLPRPQNLPHNTPTSYQTQNHVNSTPVPPSNASSSLNASFSGQAQARAGTVQAPVSSNSHQPLNAMSNARGTAAPLANPLSAQHNIANSTPRLSPIEQVRAGRIPDIFLVFKENIRRTGETSDRVAETHETILEAEKAMDWIMQNPREGVVPPPNGPIKISIYHIIWELILNKNKKPAQPRNHSSPSLQSRSPAARVPPIQAIPSGSANSYQARANNSPAGTVVSAAPSSSIPPRTSTPSGLVSQPSPAARNPTPVETSPDAHLSTSSSTSLNNEPSTNQTMPAQQNHGIPAKTQTTLTGSSSQMPYSQGNIGTAAAQTQQASTPASTARTTKA